MSEMDLTSTVSIKLFRPMHRFMFQYFNIGCEVLSAVCMTITVVSHVTCNVINMLLRM